MEPTTSGSSSAKIITALIIGLIVGFLAGAFWQARRLSAPALDTTAAALESATTKATLDADAKKDIKLSEKKEPAGEAKSAATAVTSVVTPATSSGTLTLKVIDQQAGDNVAVSVTGVTEAVWAAVRETKDGKVGNILGAHKVFTGETSSTIELLRPTVAGATYKVVLYKDIGDPAFNYREDVLVEGVDGTFSAK